MSYFTKSGWIGVILDGGLAIDTGPECIDKIGPVIEPTLARIHEWLRQGYEVRIFTARASVQEQVLLIKEYLSQFGLDHLEVTNQKDFMMIELWGDRCRQVIPNTGIPVDGI